MAINVSTIKKIYGKAARLINIYKRFITSRNYRWIFWFKEIQPKLVKKNNTSEMPLDVVILAIEKDLETLPYVIDGIRKNIKHPVSNIFIVSPLSDKIQKLCLEKECIFINERSVLDINPDNIKIIIQGLDRSKWYYQQLLKLSCEKFSNEKYYLVVDSDTVFIRPQSFEHNGKIIFNISDEYHRPYFEIYRRIFRESVKCPVSFISHKMIFEKGKLKEFKKKLEDINGCVWHEAILRNLDLNEKSGYSEYETYGQYLFSHYRSSISLEYWFNLSLKRESLNNLDQLEYRYSKEYKSISFHSWNR